MICPNAPIAMACIICVAFANGACDHLFMTNTKNKPAAESTLAPQICRHCLEWNNYRRCGCDAACIERGEPTHAEKMATIQWPGAEMVW